jgi:membrane-associated phospholipid phosphatase
VRRFVVLVRIWLLLFVICGALTAFLFVHIDVPFAQRFWKVGASLTPLNSAFGAAVILTVEAAVALSLIVARVVRGHISRFGATMVVACLASICTYGINDEVLKPFFGVPVPAEVIQGASHSINLLAGSGNNGFPSGHMVLASAFAGVFMSCYRASRWPFAALLLLAAGLLVFGDWHFLSDVLAGTFVGLSAGALAGEAMLLHRQAAAVDGARM